MPLDDEYDVDDDPRDPEEFDCLFPAECCMPGFHYASECHTAEYYERQRREDEMRAEWDAEMRLDAFGA